MQAVELMTPGRAGHCVHVAGDRDFLQLVRPWYTDRLFGLRDVDRGDLCALHDNGAQVGRTRLKSTWTPGDQHRSRRASVPE